MDTCTNAEQHLDADLGDWYARFWYEGPAGNEYRYSGGNPWSPNSKAKGSVLPQPV